jgi:hypothetical protein
MSGRWFLQDLGTYGIGIFTPTILAASIGHKTDHVLSPTSSTTTSWRPISQPFAYIMASRAEDSQHTLVKVPTMTTVSIPASRNWRSMSDEP